MKPYLKHFVLVGFILLIAQSSAYAARVGIFGCAHGDAVILERIMQNMKNENVTHLIGNGDFVSAKFVSEKPMQLEQMLAQMANQSGVAKDKTYLMPGNWEDADSTTAEQLQATRVLFEKHGHLISTKYDSAGSVTIDGKKIQIAHFPQHPIPSSFLPTKDFLYVYNLNQAHTVRTMANKMTIPDDVDLNVYGHTHLRSFFFDDQSGKLTINAGGLSSRKLPSELRSYAIYDTDQGTVEFYSIEPSMISKDQPAELLAVVPIKKNSEMKPEELGTKAAKLKTDQEVGSHDLQDFSICKLDKANLANVKAAFSSSLDLFQEILNKSE